MSERSIHLRHRPVLLVEIRCMAKRLNRQPILSLIEKRDAVVVPAPPIRNRTLVTWIWRYRRIVTNVNYKFRLRHVHNRIVHGFSERVVAKDSRKPAIAKLGRQMKSPARIRWDCELITRHVRSTRIDLIVLRKYARPPNVMFIVIGAVRLHKVGLVIVGRLVKITVWFDKARSIKRLARIVADDELDKGFIKIAQLRWERMPDVFICDDYFCCESIAAGNAKTTAIDRSDDLFGFPACCTAPNREDIYAECIILKKLCNRIELIRKLVESRYCGIGCGPPVRNQHSLLG